jgi:hypothetical protein
MCSRIGIGHLFIVAIGFNQFAFADDIGYSAASKITGSTELVSRMMAMCCW